MITGADSQACRADVSPSESSERAGVERVIETEEDLP
jgi:hypothetical protein